MAMIKSKLADLTRRDATSWPKAGGLSSDASPWALSLDYALSKKPRWLLDMFGVDKSGTPVIKRLFLRNNPEKKRPGPCWVSVNPEFLHPSNIAIFLDDIEVSTESELHKLLSRLGFREEVPLPELNQSNSIKLSATKVFALRKPLQESVQPPTISSFNLAEDISNEIRRMLWQTDIFSRDSLIEGYRRLISRGHFRHHDNPSRDLLSDADLSCTSLYRLGLAEYGENFRRKIKDRPLRFATGAAAFSSIALLQHLKTSKLLPIVIDYSHINTRELVWDIQRWSAPVPPPEAVIVSVSCASMLLAGGRATSYIPTMILPGNSHQLVSTAHDKLSKRGVEWLFITDEKTTSSFYFEELVDTQSALRKDARAYVEQAELLKATRCPTRPTNAILWYPHYRFQSVCNSNSLTPLPHQTWDFTGNVLFLREDISHDLGFWLNIALRDSWLDLRASPESIGKFVSSLLEDENYLRYLHRTSGLSHYPECTYEALRTALPLTQQGTSCVSR